MEWLRLASCRDHDPEIWWPLSPRGYPGMSVEGAHARHEADVNRAKAICGRCPVLADCRAWAIESLPHGIAGGLTEQERSDLRVAEAAVVCDPLPPILRGTSAKNAESRREGYRLLADGVTPVEVAALLGVNARTVWRWQADLRRAQQATAGAR